MTRLPTESRDYKGLDGPGYESYRVGPLCSVPGCGRPADHSHHIVRRSELGGPFLWVQMPSGEQVGNLTGLCWRHHNEVTENKARITFETAISPCFFWTDSTITNEPLTPQPPIKEESETDHQVAESTSPTVELGIGHVLAVGHDRETCPTCKRPMPRPKIDTPKEDKKPRGTWAVAVPLDERENGADTLDDLLDAARDKLDKVGISYGDGSQVKFYPLTTALGLFIQHADKILSDD